MKTLSWEETIASLLMVPISSAHVLFKSVHYFPSEFVQCKFLALTVTLQSLIWMQGFLVQEIPVWNCIFCLNIFSIFFPQTVFATILFLHNTNCFCSIISTSVLLVGRQDIITKVYQSSLKMRGILLFPWLTNTIHLLSS